MVRKTNVRSHNRKTKSGKVASVQQHLRQLPADIRKKVIAFETEREKKKAEAIKKRVEAEERRAKEELARQKAREKERAELVKAEKKLAKTKEEAYKSLKRTLKPSLEKDYVVFKSGNVWEVRKGLFDRHAFSSKTEAMNYKEHRIDNELRKKSGLKQKTKKFNFKEVPEYKAVKKELKEAKEVFVEEFKGVFR